MLSSEVSRAWIVVVGEELPDARHGREPWMPGRAPLVVVDAPAQRKPCRPRRCFHNMTNNNENDTEFAPGVRHWGTRWGLHVLRIADGNTLREAIITEQEFADFDRDGLSPDARRERALAFALDSTRTHFVVRLPSRRLQRIVTLLLRLAR